MVVYAAYAPARSLHKPPLYGLVCYAIVGMVCYGWYCMLWFGVVCYGLVWYAMVGIVWYGMLWLVLYGMVDIVWYGWNGMVYYHWQYAPCINHDHPGTQHGVRACHKCNPCNVHLPQAQTTNPLHDTLVHVTRIPMGLVWFCLV